jgi:uncharacterized membrane protein
MERDRLTAFSDGVIAVIITIMVLEMRPPHGADLHALVELAPAFLSYVLSFVYVAIYWNNHHHFFQLVTKVDGAILWANMHLLFWLSLIPFATAWVGANPVSPAPTAVYGVALLMPALAWSLMQSAIIRAQGKVSALARALGGHRTVLCRHARGGCDLCWRRADVAHPGPARRSRAPTRFVLLSFGRRTALYPSG